MTTNNHSAISTGAAANASTINTPLGALDAAIGAAVSTLTTTAKTAVGGINELDADVGDPASLTTTVKSDLVAAINEINLNGPAKLAGGNSFAGDQTLANNLLLPNSTGATVGVIKRGAASYMHNYNHPTADGGNIFIGSSAGNFTSSPGGGGSYLASTNIGIGGSALAALTTGFNNVAMGSNGLKLNTTGADNTAIGSTALSKNTTGSYNVAVGYAAGVTETVANGNASGSYNIWIGMQAGPADTTQYTGSIAIGHLAKTTASYQVILGGPDITSTILYPTITSVADSATAYSSTALSVNPGTFDLFNVKNDNAAAEMASLRFSTRTSSSSIGRLAFIHTADYGAFAFLLRSSGATSNTQEMMRINSSGHLTAKTSMGISSTVIYAAAGSGVQNAVIGGTPGDGTVPLSSNTTGAYNVVISGSGNTMTDNTTGSYNVAIGVDNLRHATTGHDNVAIGAGSMGLSTMTGYGNVGIGTDSLRSIEDGYRNVSVGMSSLWSVTTGHLNNTIGTSSLYYNTTGHSNNAMGYIALQYNDTGNYNVAIGNGSGVTADTANANVSGSYNVWIGDYAGPGVVTQLSSCVAIGAGALNTQSNQVVLGSPYTTQTVLRGTQLVVGTDATAVSNIFQIVPSYVVNTHASYTSRSIFSQYAAAGAQECMRFESGAAAMVGFFGHVANVQPAKASHNNWAAISDITAALAEIGLIDAA